MKLLQGSRLDLAAHDQTDPAVFRISPLQLHLGRQYVAADPADRTADPLQERRAGNGQRLSFEERGAGGTPPQRGTAILSPQRQGPRKPPKHVFRRQDLPVALAITSER